jgi:hypothetical protein
VPWSSGMMPSAMKPPRPPSKNKTVPMVTVIRNGNYFRDEKGDKAWWMCNVEQAVHLVPVVLLACLLILYICSSAQFHEYKMLGDKMNQNVVEATMMTERHLQQAGSSKSQAEEQQTLSMRSLENISTELQHHPSDLPVNPLMLRGVGHCNRCWNQLTKTKQEMSPASCRFCWNHQRS